MQRPSRITQRKRLAVTGQLSTVFAIQKIAHGLPARLIHFTRTLAIDSIHRALGHWINRIGLTALRTAIGKPGFIGLQFELFSAYSADFDGISHSSSMITKVKRRWHRLNFRMLSLYPAPHVRSVLFIVARKDFFQLRLFDGDHSPVHVGNRER